MPSPEPFTGGCQCGAVRYRVERLGEAAICHCRMCQKAFGGFYAPLVSGFGVAWTRGAPSYFQSSNRFRRGFCAKCGTPLTYERLARGAGDPIDLAIGTLDDPSVAPPTRQVNRRWHVAYVDGLADLPSRSAEDDAWTAGQGIISLQHPDRDTAVWPPQRGDHHG